MKEKNESADNIADIGKCTNEEHSKSLKKTDQMITNKTYEEYFDLFFSSPVGHVIISNNGIIEEANLTAARLLGLDRNQLLKQCLNNFILEQDRNIYSLNSERLYTTKEKQQFDIRLIKSEGTFFWANIISVLIEKADGTFINSTTITDISDRKLKEEKQHDKEFLLSMIHNNVADIIFAVSIEPDNQFRFISINNKFSELTGLPEDRVVGKLVQEVIPESAHALVLEKYNEAIQNRQPAYWEGISIFPNREKIGEVTIAPVFDLEGKCTLLIVTVHDITGRKLSESTLRDSEEKYRELVQASSDAIAIYRGEKIVFINPAGFLLLRAKDRDDVLGKSVLEFIHPDSREIIIKRMRKVREEGKPLPLAEEKFIRLDGSIVEVEVKAIPITFEKQPAVQLIIRDITERKLAEQALKDSKEKLNKFAEDEHIRIQELAVINAELKNARVATLNIIEDLSNEIEERKHTEEKLLHTQDQLLEAQRLTHSGSWEADFISGKLSWSDEMYSIYGVSPETFGHTREALLELIHPEDRHILINTFKTNLSGKQNPKSHQIRIIHPDGSIHIVESSNRAYFDSNRKLIRVIGSTQDITERKNVEKELLIKQFAVESSVSAIGLADLQGKIIYVNNAYMKMWGYNDLKEILGKEIPDFADSKEEIGNAMMALQSGKKFIGEGDAKRKDGTTFSVMVSANIVTSPDGKPICLMASFIDVTERKQAEITLRESEDRYRDLIENSSDLICTHDMDGNLFSVNKAAVKITGYSEKELLNINLRDIIVPENKRLFTTYLAKIKISGKAEGLLTIQTKTGERRVWEYNNTLRTQGVAKPIVRGMARDITDQRKVQESLRESELRFKQVSENAREWIWEVDKKGLYTYASPVLKDILGYEPEEVVGKKYFYDFFEKKVKEEIKKSALEVFARKDSFKDLININIHKDGREIILSTSGVPILDDKGDLLGYRGVDVDITERKRAEEKLQESETKYRLLFENNPHPMWLYDLKTLRFLTVNNAAVNKYGYSKEEFLSMTIKDIRPQEEVALLLENISESKEDLQKSGAWKHKLKNGKIIFVEIHSYKMDYENKQARLVLANDVTERKRAEDAVKESEEKFRKLTETASDSIITIDSNGKIISWNKSAERTFGYTFDEVNGKASQIILPQKYKLFHTTTLTELYTDFQQRIYGKTITVQAIRKDKTVFPIELSLSSWEANNSVYYTAIIRDISERVKVEHELETYRNNLEELVKARTEELDKANESLQRKIEKDKEIEMILKQSLEKEKELNEMKSRFISTTSHEFRTPLTSVLSSAELLQRYAARWSDDKKNQHLERIQKSVEYLTKLLDDVLTLSRTESGKISYNPELVDLRKFAEECVEDVKSLLTARHDLNLSYKSRQENFKLDPKLLKFILNNMLSNAVKYSPDGGKVELKISTSKKYLIMEISDNGIGIAADELGKIYEAFYRTKNIGTIAGTGLGLAIVKHAVELHNGEISVRSEINKGTTFVIKIPQK